MARSLPIATRWSGGSPGMARITSVHTRGEFIVSIAGGLAARDLRQLERVCGPAVERRVPLRVIIQAGCVIDEYAGAYLKQLRASGAWVEHA